MKSKLTKPFFLFLFLLSSCKQTSLANCYQCYFGKMFISNATIDYENINHTKITQNNPINEEDYYVNQYLISAKNKKSILENDKIHFSQADQDKINSLDDKTLFLYSFVQIPIGYEGFKRDNVQGYIFDQKQVLITDNYYYFNDRPDLLYCEIDIKENKDNLSNTTFVFYFEIDIALYDFINLANTRFFFRIK